MRTSLEVRLQIRLRIISGKYLFGKAFLREPYLGVRECDLIRPLKKTGVCNKVAFSSESNVHIHRGENVALNAFTCIPKD